MKLNEVKKCIEQALNDAVSRISGAGKQRVRDPKFDSTLPGPQLRIGRLHPITQTIEELKDIMGRLGFTPAEGPEVEDDWHNFEALNIPACIRREIRWTIFTFPWRCPAHELGIPPASAESNQHRANPSDGNDEPPVRIISLGRVYRPDTADATHYPMFHQMEGLLIDRDM